MVRVVAGRAGLARGRESRAFSAGELRAALDFASDHLELRMEVGGAGALVAVCARGEVAPAAAPLALPLAPDVQRRDVELCRAGGGGGLRLRTVRDVPPAAALHMWFDEHLLAALDMPFLTPRNIKGRKSYECHECGVQFERPNPLKLHMFLSCEPYAPRAFWRRALQRLAPAPLNLSVQPRSPDTAELAARCLSEPPLSAFRPYRHAWLSGLALLPPPPPGPWRLAAATAAEAEAFATDWGKSKEGHLCLYCGKVYSRKYGLKIHIRTHTGYKPLQCKYCFRPFGDPSNLNKHVRLHAQAQSDRGDGGAAGAGGVTSAHYACPHARCGKLLVRRRDLERHLRSRHTHTPHTPSHTPHSPSQTPHSPSQTPHSPQTPDEKNKTIITYSPSP